jgi:hypothetical protein
MSDDQQAEIERLRAENERLKRTRDARLAMKVSEKGALSFRLRDGPISSDPGQRAVAETSRDG